MLVKVPPEQSASHLIEVSDLQLFVHLNPLASDDVLPALLDRVLPRPVERFLVEWLCEDDHGWDVFRVFYDEGQEPHSGGATLTGVGGNNLVTAE